MLIGAERCAQLRSLEKTMSISRVTAMLLIMPPHSPRADSGGTPTADAQCAPLRRGLVDFEQLQLIKRLFIF